MRSPTSTEPHDESAAPPSLGRRTLRLLPRLHAMGRVLLALTVIGATWFVWEVGTDDTSPLTGDRFERIDEYVADQMHGSRILSGTARFLHRLRHPRRARRRRPGLDAGSRCATTPTSRPVDPSANVPARLGTGRGPAHVDRLPRDHRRTRLERCVRLHSRPQPGRGRSGRPNGARRAHPSSPARPEHAVHRHHRDGHRRHTRPCGTSVSPDSISPTPAGSPIL